MSELLSKDTVAILHKHLRGLEELLNKLESVEYPTEQNHDLQIIINAVIVNTLAIRTLSHAVLQKKPRRPAT